MSKDKSYTALLEWDDGHRNVFLCLSPSLSFAVWLIDDSTKKEPLGEIRVTLNGENIASVKAVKNLSGYYTFSSLPEGKYTLSVESEIYLSHEESVEIPFSPSKEPVIPVTLMPRPSYPFPDRATFLRYMLT